MVSEMNCLPQMKYILSRRNISVVGCTLATIISVFCVVSRFYFDKPQPSTAATIAERNYYIVTTPDGSDTVLVYPYHNGDTLLALPSDTSFLKRITRYRPSSWVNRFWIPSCFATLASRVDTMAETASKMRILNNASACSFIGNRYKALAGLLTSYRRQLSEIDYYMQRHSVGDEGFDIVARRRSVVSHNIDSVTKLMTHAQPIVNAKNAKAVEHSDYFVIGDTSAVPARKITSHRKGFYFYKAIDGKMPDGARPVYAQAADIGYGMNTGNALMALPDTVIVGRKNNKKRYEGVVSIYYPDGKYYEGQCVDTVSHPSSVAITCVPDGFGVEFTDKKVNAGLWKDGRYRGEQPLYTSAHIYGIDISRYQHEPSGKAYVVKRIKGRKRRVKVSYPIDWSKLRITSLGTLSKKRVSGTVDFPISFIYIKCSEGKSLVNQYYHADYQAARKHGYRVGGYHFFSTKAPVSQQASLFLRTCRYSHGDLPPVLDVEPTTKLINQMGGPAVMLSAVRKWLVSVEKAMKVRPVLYVSQIFVNKYLNEKYADGEYLRDNYQVWIARYGEYKPDVHLAIWQLSPDGRVRGIRGEVDINVFNGYDDLFREFK